MTIKPFVAAALWLAVITILSVSPSVQLPKIQLFSADKLAHAGSYALLAWLLIWGIWRTKGRKASWGEIGVVFCLASGYGAFMEWVQGTFFPNRFFEYGDMLANAAGAFLAVLLVNPLSKIAGPKSKI